MRIVIYTAICGGYDILKEQPRFKNVDYICFTDEEALSSNFWQIIKLPKTNLHPRLKAKGPKTNPFKFLPAGYDIAIWIDGSMVIASPHFIALCLRSLNQNGIAAMNHPVGNCIYDEAVGCLKHDKYKGLPILEQVRSYKAEGYPEKNGLAACGILVWNLAAPKLQKVAEDWLSENLKWTYQDQLSFPYALWKNELWYDELQISYFDRSLFVLFNHQRED